MQRKNEIVLKNLQHRGHDALGLYFPYDDKLKQIAKNLGAKWSQTNKCWWLPNTPSNFNQLISAYKDIAWLDMNGLQRKQSTNSPAVKKPQKSNPLIDLLPASFHETLSRIRYQEPTKASYRYYFNQFLNFIQPLTHQDFGEDDIKRYQYWLVNTKKVSTSTQNIAINAIKFYLEKVCGNEKRNYYIERPIEEKQLPPVLSEQEVLRVLAATPNPKHRLIFALFYSTGVRMSEMINLRKQDIDFDRKMVFVKGGKGKKDRYTLLSTKLIPVINTYYEQYKPNYWFIEGPKRKQYSDSSIRHSLKRSINRARIEKHVTPHTFRHSFATHLLERGTDIRYIQELLGHSSPETTAIYTQISNKNLQKIKNPLDQITGFKNLLINEL